MNVPEIMRGVSSIVLAKERGRSRKRKQDGACKGGPPLGWSRIGTALQKLGLPVENVNASTVFG